MSVLAEMSLFYLAKLDHLEEVITHVMEVKPDPNLRSAYNIVSNSKQGFQMAHDLFEKKPLRLR